MSKAVDEDPRTVASEAALKVAEDIGTGKVKPAALEAQVLKECRELFARVDGPEDLLWPMHVEIFHRVLEVGGAIPADELGEWAAVYRAAEVDAAAEAERVDSLTGTGVPDLVGSSVSVALRADSGAVDGAAGDGGSGGVE